MAKYRGYSTALQLSIASTFTTIAQVARISGPSLSVDTVDVTTLDSASAWREFVGTVVDGGEVTFDLVFDPVATTQQALTDVLDAGAESWKILWSDAATTAWPFTGILTGFSPGAEFDGAMTASCSIKISAAMTLPT